MDGRFHRPPEWISWVLGIVALFDLLPLLVTAFFVVCAAENHVSDLPTDCDPDHCPVTPEQHSRDLTILCGSVVFWLAAVYLIYRLLLACLDAQRRRNERLIATALCVAGMAAILTITYRTLGSWVQHNDLITAYVVAALILACFPAYLAVRHQYFRSLPSDVPERA